MNNLPDLLHTGKNGENGQIPNIRFPGNPKSPGKSSTLNFLYKTIINKNPIMGSMRGFWPFKLFCIGL